MGGTLSYPIRSMLLEREGNPHYRVGKTDMQGYRESMEDAMTVLLGMGKGRENWAFLGVFDGHAGKKASAFLGEKLHSHICALEDPFDAAQLQECVCKFDALFCSDPARRDDGSTCVFAILRPADEACTHYEIVVSNTGDSRVVIIRKDSGTVVTMTSDHKPQDPPEAERIYAAGGMVAMNRTDGQLAMSRAIGDFMYKSNADLPQHKQKVIPTPDITYEKVQAGDLVLVMCDGIVEQMSNEDAGGKVVESMKEHNDPAKAVAELFAYSLERGSKDNHSAIICVVEDGTSYVRPAEFVAGPFHPFKGDSTFRDRYLQDAARHGIEGETLFEAAKKTEAEMGPFENVSSDNDQEFAGAQYMQLLQRIQANYNLSGQFLGGANPTDDANDDSNVEDDDDQ